MRRGSAMGDEPMRWRVTWFWSPPGVRPGKRDPSSIVYPTEGEARDKLAALRELAVEFGATVAGYVKPEPMT